MRPRRTDERSSERITIRVSPEERDRIRQASRANRQRVSDFARDAIVTATSDTLDDDQEASW